MKAKYTIYKLIDPRNQKIRYIGLTFNSLKHRLNSHCHEKGKSHKINWVQSLIKIGLKPIIDIVEDGLETYESACEKEIFYISKFSNEGHDLTNSCSGGNKNKKMSIDVRNKMSESIKKYLKLNPVVIEESTRIKISKSAKKRFEDPEEIIKLKISNKKFEDSKTPEQKINDILIQDCKSVIQYDKNMNIISEFLSIRDASRKTNIERSNISKCCKNKAKTAGGYKWKYKDNI
jgi:group I intron endonuclease